MASPVAQDDPVCLGGKVTGETLSASRDLQDLQANLDLQEEFLG